MSKVIDEEVIRIPGTPDLKTEIAYRFGVPYPKFYQRGVTHVFTLSISVPDSGDFTSVIKKSIGIAIAGAAASSFLFSPSTAIPAFKTAFWAALIIEVGDAISEFEWIGINDREIRDEWKPV